MFTSSKLGVAITILAAQWRTDREMLWLVPELKVEYNKISAFYPFLRETKALVILGAGKALEDMKEKIILWICESHI